LKPSDCSPMPSSSLGGPISRETPGRRRVDRVVFRNRNDVHRKLPAAVCYNNRFRCESIVLFRNQNRIFPAPAFKQLRERLFGLRAVPGGPAPVAGPHYDDAGPGVIDRSASSAFLLCINSALSRQISAPTPKIEWRPQQNQRQTAERFHRRLH
jgi:hypothetical protein